MFDKFTHKAQEVIINAQIIAQEFGQQYINALHLLIALLEQNDSLLEDILQQLKVNDEELRLAAENWIERLPKSAVKTPVGMVQGTAEMAMIMERAGQIAGSLKDESVDVEHLLLAIAGIESPAQAILAQKGLDENKFKRILKKWRANQPTENSETENRPRTTLEKYTVNLTEAAKAGKLDPVIGRADEIKRLMQVLSRRTKNNPVLVGEAGTGKTAIVEGLAQRLALGDAPESLQGKDLLSLDLGALIAGAKFRGEFEDRLKTVLKEIKSNANQPILFIDELHTIVGAGASEGSMDASNLLKPALARGELRAIGATTTKEYHHYIERDAALERRFQPVLVSEPSVEETMAILRGIKEKYEIHHGVRISDKAIAAAVTLSVRYINDRFLPDKAIDLMDEATSALKMAIDSSPDELDNLKKEINQLSIQKANLIAGQPHTAAAQVKILNQQIADSKTKAENLENRWRHEQAIIREIKKTKLEIENLRQQADTIERSGEDLAKVAEIRYAKVPELDKQIKAQEKLLTDLQAAGQRILKEEVDAEDIARVVAKWTGVPVSKMLDSEIKKLVDMEKFLQARVVGQTDAINAVAQAIRRARAGISEEKRPIGSFIFIGPTGVGKTELAKALAGFMFNDEAALIRLDMSEYMEKHSISKMIGSPPGYVGHDEGGQLTDLVRQKPYSVILFDEIEKAHPEVFNMLLQILDDGRLTDAKGRHANFKNTVIIMTSNLGNEIIKNFSIGFNETTATAAQETNKRDQIKEKIDRVLKQNFKPEFLNRIDETIVFNSLNKEDLNQIVDLELTKVEHRLANQDIKLRVAKNVRQLLADKSFDRQFGARPLKRIIQNLILNELATEIISGQIKQGDQVLINLGMKDEILLKVK